MLRLFDVRIAKKARVVKDNTCFLFSSCLTPLFENSTFYEGCQKSNQRHENINIPKSYRDYKSLTKVKPRLSGAGSRIKKGTNKHCQKE